MGCNETFDITVMIQMNMLYFEPFFFFLSQACRQCLWFESKTLLRVRQWAANHRLWLIPWLWSSSPAESSEVMDKLKPPRDGGVKQIQANHWASKWAKLRWNKRGTLCLFFIFRKESLVLCRGTGQFNEVMWSLEMNSVVMSCSTANRSTGSHWAPEPEAQDCRANRQC